MMIKKKRIRDKYMTVSWAIEKHQFIDIIKKEYQVHKVLSKSF